ncbi:MAG TPA: DUF4383 domain-containing protein [Lacisediminihabitans sp.]|nr:DUF4383 domain-containing protein [Lacisediminihabitans sp.]HXD62340.1 DUF4383 domain-containing protein [Lacisediminihabitans sp.]
MTKSPNRMLATIFGAVYLLIGLLGFAVTGGVGFIATKGGLLLGLFEVNPLHNVAHLLIGAALVIAGLSSIRASRTVNSVIGAVYLLLGIVGLFILDSPANILAINGWDNVLHFASAIILLGVGLGADKGRVATA